MTAEEVGRLHTARPFRPFDIHLADRRTFTVEHPEQLAVGGRMLGVALPDDTIEIIDLFLVISLKPRANGSHRRRRRR